jgi:hypothetical protein
MAAKPPVRAVLTGQNPTTPRRGSAGVSARPTAWPASKKGCDSSVPPVGLTHFVARQINLSEPDNADLSHIKSRWKLSLL